ncbi:MAG: hypothetical protein JW768_11610 [Chitinispirillaceae bacterium]|nr:hypothetical protein [Chitinispirillaceae bacterium]
MRETNFLLALFTALGLCAGIAGAQEIATKYTPSGFVSLRQGQVVKGEPDRVFDIRASTNNVWVQEMYTGFNVFAELQPLNVTGNLGFEMRICNEYPRYVNDFGLSRRLYYYPYLSRADLSWSLGGREDHRLALTGGFFPFKYNADAHNLGEYLFRSGTYPQYILTEFDFPMARLLGVHASGTVAKMFTWDVLLTSNIEWTALGDVNLIGIASFKPHPLVEIGAGAGAYSLISVNDSATTPRNSNSAYVDGNDTLYYSFAGTKLMGRVTLDLKAILPWDIFGKEDVKAFGEVAVLGVKDYPASLNTYVSDSLLYAVTDYSTILERLPVMFGFNWPTHPLASYAIAPAVGAYFYSQEFNRKSISIAGSGVVAGIGIWWLERYIGKNLRLDLFSIQGEWFASRAPNDMSPVVFDNQPVQLSSMRNMTSNCTPRDYEVDDWKWSVYARRTFAGHFQMTGQIARDHMRWYRMSFKDQDWEEALRKGNDWYWTMKFGYLF